MLTSDPSGLAPEEIEVVEWVRYVETMGYVGLDEFREMPAGLVNFVAAVKVADNLRQLKVQLLEAKDRELRKDLQEKIAQLEGYFNE